jgi:hypothetical protein
VTPEGAASSDEARRQSRLLKSSDEAMLGRRFGRLTVLRRSTSHDKQDRWMCACDCGRETVSIGFCLRGGQSKSCGCVAAEKAKQRWADPETRAKMLATLPKPKNKRHGMSKHRAYRTWSDMKQRCLNKSNSWYPEYGGRGIQVDERWLCFDSFWEDMGSSWGPGMSLGRKDNDLGYNKENCRWETSAQQMSNTRANVYIKTPLGQMTLSDAARTYRLSVGCIKYRMSVGMKDEELIKSSQRKQHDK